MAYMLLDQHCQTIAMSSMFQEHMLNTIHCLSYWQIDQMDMENMSTDSGTVDRCLLRMPYMSIDLEAIGPYRVHILYIAIAQECRYIDQYCMMNIEQDRHSDQLNRVDIQRNMFVRSNFDTFHTHKQCIVRYCLVD